MRLERLHPGVAARSCADCRAYLHDDRGGHFGRVLTRGGRPVPRPPRSPTPCVLCPKIPPGADPKPENAAELTGRAAEAYRHYRECRAVGDFPNDPVVRYVAVLAREAEEAAGRADARRLALTVLGNSFRGE